VLEIKDIHEVYAKVSESQECVESRLAAHGDGVEGHEMLDVGTLLIGGKRFLEI